MDVIIGAVLILGIIAVLAWLIFRIFMVFVVGTLVYLGLMSIKDDIDFRNRQK